MPFRPPPVFFGLLSRFVIRRGGFNSVRIAGSGFFDPKKGVAEIEVQSKRLFKILKESESCWYLTS